MNSEKNDKLLKIVKKFQHHDNDTGSLEFQIVSMTAKINELSEHFAKHSKDFSSRRGLMALVNRRRKFLDSLKKDDSDTYKKLIDELNLRK